MQYKKQRRTWAEQEKKFRGGKKNLGGAKKFFS
jgi:hypothetical protein